jgi:hypothetical protein
MERFWTGNKDTDRSILLSIESDRDLLNACLTNKYAKELCDDSFFHNRLLSKYKSTIPYKKEKSWKNYFLKVLYYIDKMKTDFDFNFTSGNPELYYTILKKGQDISEDIGIERATRHGLDDLIEYYKNYDYPWEISLPLAIESEKKSTVELILKLKEKEGGGILDVYNQGLYLSASKGNEELVNLFLSKGANNLTESLKSASKKGHLKIVEILKNKI